MNTTPKANRLQIGIFGRTNVGKSSVLNYIAGQDTAITSPVAGTTTDVVEKTMELLPLGPVVLHDTAGLDDSSELGEVRIRKTEKVYDRADVILLVMEPGVWTDHEQTVVIEAAKRKVPVIGIVNKVDAVAPSDVFLSYVHERVSRTLNVSTVDRRDREAVMAKLKRLLIDVAPEDFMASPPILKDLIPARDGLVVLIMPIDFEAPKGRLILPQVQAIRDGLDGNGIVVVVKETQYLTSLGALRTKPDLVVCDSQVVDRMVEETPPDVPCTTFSILFSRARGDLEEAARGAPVVNKLAPRDRVLVAEACSHHPIQDDIGRSKLPKWLETHVGGPLAFETVAGRDYPADLESYRLVIHCGGCMIPRREMLSRIQRAREAKVPITNYGIAISAIKGVAERVLTPFPAALAAFRESAGRVAAEVLK